MNRIDLLYAMVEYKRNNPKEAAVINRVIKALYLLVAVLVLPLWPVVGLSWIVMRLWEKLNDCVVSILRQLEALWYKWRVERVGIKGIE